PGQPGPEEHAEELCLRPEVGDHLGDRPLAGVRTLFQLVRAEGLDAGSQAVVGAAQRADPRARARFHSSLSVASWDESIAQPTPGPGNVRRIPSTSSILA